MTEPIKLIHAVGDEPTLRSLAIWLSDRFSEQVKEAKSLIGKKVCVGRNEATFHIPERHANNGTVESVAMFVEDELKFRYTVDCDGPVVELTRKQFRLQEEVNEEAKADMNVFRQAAKNSKPVGVLPDGSIAYSDMVIPPNGFVSKKPGLGPKVATINLGTSQKTIHPEGVAALAAHGEPGFYQKPPKPTGGEDDKFVGRRIRVNDTTRIPERFFLMAGTVRRVYVSSERSFEVSMDNGEAIGAFESEVSFL